MAPGDSFHFRVQRGRGQWSTTLAATTKDDQAPMVALHRAISQGLPHRARKFLSQRPLAVDVPDRAGRTALLLAVLRGDVELVYLLLNAGADPNHAAEGAANRTPLMLAAHRGAATLCRALRDRGARWDVPDRNGCTALHYAVAGDGVAGLRSAAAAPASSGGTEEVVRMALEDGADVHVPDSYGWTPLMRAVMLGARTNILALLLEAGADVRQLDKQGHSAAHLAALGGRQDVAAVLARSGADLRTKSRHGHSARELGRCWPLSLADGANKGGIEAALAVAAAASAMLKKRAARRKQDELDDQI
ncbi:fibronectin type 3 and ankyrin repeat domains 1 protein-like [Frankliniella occidentalis]|uniref:Fibronectin type 3 and ankyrin repeat domains 1 protein-like n=1 Tax=Frankliniella occidentalis TaxID=133901 RepID=A0A6J1S7H5_FRAOC|nr:fibronectin type 3 and ankyrin repeat domains 1 protein-like [Frankliniella occidentalis]